jgi:DNA-binding PadR family transcriptional regulator
MAGDVRVTVPVAKVLRVFLEDSAVARYGFDLMERTGLASGSLYPILVRLERAEWLVGAKEDIDPRAAGRPPRRYFKLTGLGERVARQRLAELAQEFAP